MQGNTTGSHGYQNNSHAVAEGRHDQGQHQVNPYHADNTSGQNNYTQMSANQNHGQSTGGSGARPYSRGHQPQTKMSTNQMAKIQHHEDGRKHNVTLLSQQIPYPSTGQYPNQDRRYTFEDNRSGSMLHNP